MDDYPRLGDEELATVYEMAKRRLGTPSGEVTLPAAVVMRLATELRDRRAE